MVAKNTDETPKRPRRKTGEPKKHGSSWRIRWTDENGHRQSEVHTSQRDGKLALRRHLVETEERKRGLRKLCPQTITLEDAWVYDKSRVDRFVPRVEIFSLHGVVVEQLRTDSESDLADEGKLS
jgi:hypothetical protein